MKGYFQRGCITSNRGDQKGNFWNQLAIRGDFQCLLLPTPRRSESDSWTLDRPSRCFFCLRQQKKQPKKQPRSYRLQTQIAMNSSRLMSPIIARSLLDYAGRNTYATLQLFVVFLGTVTVYSTVKLVWDHESPKWNLSNAPQWRRSGKKYHLAPGNGMSAFVRRQPPGTFFLNRKFSKKRFWPFSPATWHGDRKVEVPVQQLKLKQSSSRPHACWKNNGSKTGHHSYSICGAVPFIALVCRAEIWDVEVWFQCSNMFKWHKHSDFILEFAITTYRNQPYNTISSLSVCCDTLSPANWTIEWVSQHPWRWTLNFWSININ